MSSKQSIYDQAYAAVLNKEYAFARRLLAQLLNQEPDHLNGWLLASYVMKTRTEAIRCLQRGLQIDPANTHARQRLAKLQQNSTDPSPTLLLHLSAERPTVPPESADISDVASSPSSKLHVNTKNDVRH